MSREKSITRVGGGQLRALRVVAADCLVAASFVALGAGCGYHVGGSVRSLPNGIRSLGIPTFVNQTHQYRLEQRITAAVVKEFSIRTRASVTSSSSGVEAVLRGEIRNISSVPVTFGSDTFGSTFLVTVQMSVKLVRTKDSAILWENSDFFFRERYVINQKVSEFFSEENPALDRLAREFAASLAGTVLHR